MSVLGSRGKPKQIDCYESKLQKLSLWNKRFRVLTKQLINFEAKERLLPNSLDLINCFPVSVFYSNHFFQDVLVTLERIRLQMAIEYGEGFFEYLE